MEYKNTLMEYVQNEFVKNRGTVIKESDDLLSSGLIELFGHSKISLFY